MLEHDRVTRYATREVKSQIWDCDELSEVVVPASGEKRGPPSARHG